MGSRRRKFGDWTQANPWRWLSLSVALAWSAIFLGWVTVFYVAFAATYTGFSFGIDPSRTGLVVLSGLVLASVVAPLFGVTWGIKLRRELEAARELDNYAARSDEEDRRLRSASEEKERARQGAQERGVPPEGG
jgi:hypothetical protein